MADADEPLEALLPQMRAAWMAGRSALDRCPPAWRAALGEGPGAEAALAALAGQAAQVAFRPTPPGALTPRPLLPALPRPQPSAAARSRLRRVLAAKGEEGRIAALVQLVDARGYAMHPADWTPDARDDWAPAVYAPWLAWAASERAAPAAEVLTAETYDNWPWAERRLALAALRRRDPAAARAVLEAKAAGEPAERRLRLVELLEERLEAADAPYLESLARDRSDRIQALAKRLLARLGHGAGGDELAAELAKMVELDKVGLIRRRHQLKLRALKTQAQENRRRDLMGLVALSDLARALGVGEAALVEAAPAGEVLACHAFAQMVADTGADATPTMLLEKVLEGDAPLALAVPLAARAPVAERLAALPAVVARETEAGFRTTLAFAGDALGAVPASALAKSPGYRALGELLRAAAGSDDTRRAQAEPQLKTALANLGLLVDVAGARTVIDACAATGVSAADPRLDLLHLNTALTPESPT